MARHYGHYSNVSRGKRRNKQADDLVPYIIESDGISREQRKKWSRLIQKIYETDPLVCPKCQGTMRIISSIEDQSLIRAILKHLGLWLVKSEPMPKAHSPPSFEYATDNYYHTDVTDDAFAKSVLPLSLRQSIIKIRSDICHILRKN